MSKNSIELRELLRNLAKSSSFDGVPNVARTKHACLRVTWTMALLVSASFCSIMVFKSVKQYLSFEVTTQYTNVIETTPSIFPSLTLCNVNPFVTNYSLEFFQKNWLHSSAKDEYYLEKLNISADAYEFERKTKAFYLLLFKAQSSVLNNTERQKLGYSFRETFLSCQFDQIECNESHFEWYYDVMLGNCFRFNTGKTLNGGETPLKTSSMSGSKHGLELQMFVGTEFNTSSDVLIPEFKQNGVQIMITDNQALPSFDEGFQLPAGTESTVQLSKVIVKKVIILLFY
jgi:hypothetical protein